MIKIINAKWLSIDAREAELILSDGQFDIICFSHPFYGKVGDSVPQPLYAVNANGICLNDTTGTNQFLEKLPGYFGYRLVGDIVDICDACLKIGDFIIKLDAGLHGDLRVGDLISVYCDRIDL